MNLYSYLKFLLGEFKTANPVPIEEAIKYPYIIPVIFDLLNYHLFLSNKLKIVLSNTVIINVNIILLNPPDLKN